MQIKLAHITKNAALTLLVTAVISFGGSLSAAYANTGSTARLIVRQTPRPTPRPTPRRSPYNPSPGGNLPPSQ